MISSPATVITTTTATFSSTQATPKGTARTQSTPIPPSFLIATLCLILVLNNNNVSASTSLSTTTTKVEVSSSLAPRSLCSQTAPSQRLLQRQRLTRQQRQQLQRQGRGQSQQEQELPGNSSTPLSSTSSSSSSSSLSPPVYRPCNQQQEQRLVVSSLSCSCSFTLQDDHHRHQQVTTQQQPQRSLAKRQTLAANEQQNNDQVSQQDTNTFPVNSLPLEADSGIGGSSNAPSNVNSPRDPPKMASSEKVLFAFIAVAVALVVFTLGFCLIKARRKSAAERTQLPMQQQQPQQPQQQQQQQPQMQHRPRPQQQHQQQQQQQQQQQSVQSQHMLSDHHTATLSTFTRISPAGPEMSALLSSAKASESRAGGFSLVRLLTKHSSSGGTSSKPRVHQFSHSRSGKDPSLQKTPSARSSNYDYDWDLSDFSKERTKDGFPVITLTSPTSSEVSIPFTSLDEQPASTSSSSALRPTNPEPRSLSPFTTIPPATTAVSRTENHFGDENGSAPTNSSMAPASSQQSIPEHMLLHPSSSINIRRLVKQEPAPPTTSPSMVDFPPTYEEALDSAGPSNRSSMTSHPNVSSHSSFVTTNTSPSYSGSSSSSQSRPPYLNGLNSTSHLDTSSIEGAQDGSVDIETDPLASLSLSYTA